MSNCAEGVFPGVFQGGGVGAGLCTCTWVYVVLNWVAHMSCTLPSGAVDLDMWRSLFNIETPYQSTEDLCGDTVDGSPAEFLVDFRLQLCINCKTRQQNSLNNFKEDSEDRGRKEWLRRWIPIIFMLHRTLLKPSHPGTARASLPRDTSRVSKRVRVQRAACGLLSGCQARVATPVDIIQDEVLRMLQHMGGGICCPGRSVQQSPVLQKPGRSTRHIIVNKINGTYTC